MWSDYGWCMIGFTTLGHTMVACLMGTAMTSMALYDTGGIRRVYPIEYPRYIPLYTSIYPLSIHYIIYLFVIIYFYMSIYIYILLLYIYIYIFFSIYI